MRRALASLMLVFVAGCGSDAEPRYGTVTLTADAPSATLSGVTAPTGPALDLAPGCAGYVDADAPEHVVELRDPGKLRVSARSERGPLALVVDRDGTFLCDSDDNTGHEPTVQLTQPGRYAIRVASLSAAEQLPYQLALGPDAKDEAGDTEALPSDALSITVTSEPTGAEVRTRAGQVMGTTPAIFVLPAGEPDAGAVELVVELEGHEAVTVRGEPAGGELVLHARLEPDGPDLRTFTADDAQPIRDFSTVHQTVTVNEDCTISHLVAEVDIRHSYIGDLLVQLRAPGGRVATLHRYRGATRNNLARAFDSNDVRMLGRLHGENARGDWRLTVRDSAELDLGSLDRFTLKLECGGEQAQRLPPRTERRRDAQQRRAARQRRRPPVQAHDVLDPWGQRGSAARLE